MKNFICKSTTGARENSEKVAGFIEILYRCQEGMYGDGSILEPEVEADSDKEVREMAELLGIPYLLFVPFDELDDESDVPERGEVYEVRFFRMADGSLRPRTPYLLRKVDDTDLI